MSGNILVSYLLILLSAIFLGTSLYEYREKEGNYKYILSIGVSFLIIGLILSFNFLRYFK